MGVLCDLCETGQINCKELQGELGEAVCDFYRERVKAIMLRICLKAIANSLLSHPSLPLALILSGCHAFIVACIALHEIFP